MNPDSIITWLQALGPAVAVYVGIRSDLAAMKVRLEHIERDLYRRRGDQDAQRTQP